MTIERRSGAAWSHQEDLTARFPVPGIEMRAFSGERAMLNWARLAPDVELPLHHHPHEQIGMVLEGELTLTIGDDTRTLTAGGLFAIPPDVPHAGRAGAEGCVAIDVFSPPREDYR